MRTPNPHYRHGQSGPKGPSPKRHALAALSILVLVPALIALAVYIKGDATDAQVRGGVIVEDFVTPPPQNVLGSAQTDLPDILGSASVQPEAGSNLPPNSQVDILGNGGSPDLGLAGPDAPPQARESTVPIGNVPLQATIGGRPLDAAGDPSLAPPPGQFVPQASQTGPLPPAPIAGLTRMTPFGPVPARSATGRSALSAYAKPASVPRNTKTVSLIVGGLGINTAQTQRAIDLLPPEVTLSFASQAANVQNWINKARAKGHEVILELPMEPYNFDPTNAAARYTLMADVPAGTNVRNLDYLMSRAQGYFAVTNYLGERFFDTETAIAPVVNYLSAAGVGLIYDGVGRNAELDRRAQMAALPMIQNRSVIDSSPQAAAVTQTLHALEASADGKTTALGMGFSYPATIDGILAWAKDLDKRDAVLVPASYALKP